ncbi:MAG: type II toxin-antitoxin system HicA family toxin [Eubacterium sp.]|nr:type II toxin-antitoxin system HicA family toxin [Eubacterium sp.]
MSKKSKLIKKLKSNPKDFSFKELETLLSLLGYEQDNSGKTSGSRVKFLNNNSIIKLHKPHNRKELLNYQVKQIIEHLEQEELI